MEKTFYITKTNRIIDETNAVVPMVETEPLYQLYLQHLQNDGEILETEYDIPEDLKLQQRDQIKAKYEIHKKNGWDAYQDFRAMVVDDIYDSKITYAQAYEIESNLKVAYDRIAQNGDWKTGYHELSQVTVSNAFVQPYMDLALAYILNYIINNYDS